MHTEEVGPGWESAQSNGSERMPELTSKSFLATLRSAEVLSEERIAEIDQEFGEGVSPKDLAMQLVRSGELTSWQAKFLLSGREGLRVGKYILRERLNQDELGDRILAIHQRLDRQVDLQILPADINEQSPAFQAFLRHTSELARLDHPNLVHVYDIDREGGRYYLVSEHFDAPSLDDVSQDATQWSAGKIVSIARQLLGGIFYAHDHHVVHGEINPHNILVAADGTAKIGNLATAALRRVIGDRGGRDTDVNSVNPQADYAECARVMLRILDFQHPQSGSSETPAISSILNPLLRTATESEVAAIIYRLDQWLEQHHQPKPFVKHWQQNTGDEMSDSPRDVIPDDAIAKAAPRRNVARERSVPVMPLVAAAVALVALGAVGLSFFLLNSKRADQIATQAPVEKTAQAAPPVAEPKAQWKPSPWRTQTDDRPVKRLPDRVRANLEKEVPNALTAQRLGGKKQPESKGDETPTRALDEEAPAVSVDSSLAVTAHEPSADDNRVEAIEPPDLEPPPLEASETNPPMESNARVEQSADESPAESTLAPSAASVPSPDSNAVSNQNPPAAAPTAAAKGPFAKTPLAIDLPGTDETKEVTLAQVEPGENFLLACSLVSDEQFTRRTKFTLERDAGEQSQTWTIIGDTSSGEPKPIAKLSLVGSDLKFQWSEGIAPELNYSFFRNCLLRLQVGDDTMLLRLRKPVAIGSAKITAAEPQAKLSFELDSFPFESDQVVTEFVDIADVQLDEGDRFTFLVEPADQIFPERGSLYVYLTEKPERFLFVELEAKIGKRSEVVAALRVQQEPKSKVFSEKLIGEVDEQLKNVAGYYAKNYAAAKDYNAPEGQITKHKAKVKELKGLTEQANLTVTDFNLQKRRAAALFSKPIRFRVYYTLADIEVELATWDGNPQVSQ